MGSLSQLSRNRDIGTNPRQEVLVIHNLIIDSIKDLNPKAIPRSGAQPCGAHFSGSSTYDRKLEHGLSMLFRGHNAANAQDIDVASIPAREPTRNVLTAHLRGVYTQGVHLLLQLDGKRNGVEVPDIIALFKGWSDDAGIDYQDTSI
ncbi:uncharacterized protein N7518_006518 [Penicillium psychrosexuale]|uniref:uncharacterized protein n=1 Tax=Penicillium psychrosexuale TaxID=1002107 RepID=UPI0025453090|nr:uncharacterized protein N7518_006518 [Penicillium psychrosexuale]KAJ5789507.1 hypothetical protein N7518_006518 [Penicillium psychrosexuale]